MPSYVEELWSPIRARRLEMCKLKLIFIRSIAFPPHGRGEPFSLRRGLGLI